jgi:putative FmdB family regulatory protein
MPTYQFTCSICGQDFEKTIPLSEFTDQVICPHGHSKVQRRYGVPRVIFKGNGYYTTDNRRSQKKEPK